MFKRNGDNNEMEVGISEILARTKLDPRPRAVAIKEPEPEKSYQRQQFPSIWNAASWLRSLTYEDMMQVATEMNAIRAEDVIDSPEKFAKLVHAWSKATTDVPPGAAQ